MTYKMIAAIANDYQLRLRLTACAAEQNKTTPVEQWAGDHAWDIAASPGWADAWASALAANATIEDYQPGNDEAVITDQMILSVVQPMV